MKHIKHFEESEEPIFNIGDYVNINRDFFKPSYKGSTNVKIIEIDDSNVPYLVELSNGENIWLRIYHIERRMTQKEIEQYKLECSTNKYNL